MPAYVADIPWAGGEGDQAEHVGRHLGLQVRRVLVDQACFLKLWPYAVWHSDAPPTHPSDAALLAVAQACRADGIKVLLTGEGSDELFGGYLWQRSTHERWRSEWLRRFFPRNASKWKVSRLIPFEGWPADGKFGRLLTVSMDADMSLLPKRLFALLAPVRPAADRAFLAHCLYSLYSHLGWILFRHDRIGMAASIEMRVPFLENEMFDFAFHLPRRAKLRRKIGKWVVKRAAAETLPPDIVYANKKGFPVPKAFWAGTEQLIEGGALAGFMHWSSDTTEDILAMLAKDEHLHFQLVGVELWLRIAFGGETPETLGEKLVAIAEDATPKLTHSPQKRRKSMLWRY